MTTMHHPTLPPAPARVDADLWTRIRQKYTQYWERDSGLWADNTWLGVPIQKMPTDAWTYQEILFRVKPDVLIETGSLAGGSALFFASIMDLVGHGEVISIDVNEWPVERLAMIGTAPRPEHPRVAFYTASSVDPQTISIVRDSLIDPGDRVMVVLDSDHSRAHVLKELDAYAPLVTPGSYLVVEDTGMDEYTNPGQGARFGAAEALAEWLPRHPEFEPDPRCERFLLTQHPGGWLRRKEAGA
jgi:cephalosporin hydroxylase